MPLTLYAVSDGPPSLAVRQCLKALNLDYKLVPINFNNGEHLTADYEKLNPQREIPVLDDDGFLLSESNAILQYLCDKYAKDDKLYPKDPKARALVNHRLCFNLASYYSSIGQHVMAPIFFDYERSPWTEKRMTMNLNVFNEYLKRLGTKYAAADNVTIADFQLCTATMCCEAIGFDLSPYPLVKKWYETFKAENPQLWAIAEEGMKEIAHFEKNHPDLSVMGTHPLHPIRKLNPQREIPVLDDDGFLLSESNAILQYLCDKYAKDDKLYPKDPKARALVNHRLCFNLASYYSSIGQHVMAPIFFDYERSPWTEKRMTMNLNVFNEYLKRLGTKYAAADNVTIADFQLCTATMCCEAIGFDLSPYPLVKKWYETFKAENPQLWAIAEEGMKEIAHFEKNHPDLSVMGTHPLHPIRKVK